MSAEKTQTTKNLNHIAPYFIVNDVAKTAKYYREALGFNLVGSYPDDEPIWGMVERDGVHIMFGRFRGKGRPNDIAAGETGIWDAYTWVDDVDGLYEEFKAKGVKITEGPFDTFYNIREFWIVDCNGYLIAFGQSLAEAG